MSQLLGLPPVRLEILTPLLLRLIKAKRSHIYDQLTVADQFSRNINQNIHFSLLKNY